MREGFHAAYDTGRPHPRIARMTLVERIDARPHRRTQAGARRRSMRWTRRCATPARRRSPRPSRDGAHGIVLSGGPKVFSAGLDVPVSAVARRRSRRVAGRVGSVLRRRARAGRMSRCRWRAAIAGHAPAGGCVLALCCDYRVMAKRPFAHRPQRNAGRPGRAGRHPAPAAARRRHASRRTLAGGGRTGRCRTRATRSAWSTNSPTIDDVATRAASGSKACSHCRASRCCRRARWRAPTRSPRCSPSGSSSIASSTPGPRRIRRPDCGAGRATGQVSLSPAVRRRPVAIGRAGSVIHPLHEPVNRLAPSSPARSIASR